MREKARRDRGTFIGGVLVPHDLTELSDAALDEVRKLGIPPSQLHVLHVLPRIDSSAPVRIWPKAEDERRIEQAKAALERRLQGTGYERARLHVQIGDPASRIVVLAKDLGVERIVMPTHSRSGLQRLLLGSVAEHVVRFAPCPVLVLPAVVVAHRAPPSPEPPSEDQSPEEQVNALACELLSQVEVHHGHLTAARIAVPPGRDPRWWEEALEERLAASGIEFVDLVVTPAPVQRARLLAARFDDPCFA